MLCDRAYDFPASGVGDKQQTAAMNVVHDLFSFFVPDVMLIITL